MFSKQHKTLLPDFSGYTWEDKWNLVWVLKDFPKELRFYELLNRAVLQSWYAQWDLFFENLAPLRTMDHIGKDSLNIYRETNKVHVSLYDGER